MFKWPFILRRKHESIISGKNHQYELLNYSYDNLARRYNQLYDENVKLKDALLTDTLFQAYNAGKRDKQEGYPFSPAFRKNTLEHEAYKKGYYYDAH